MDGVREWISCVRCVESGFVLPFEGVRDVPI